MSQRLSFFARRDALVSDPHALEREKRPTRRFVGRRWTEVMAGRWAWVPADKPEAIDYHHDLVKAAKDGDLWPADEYTAKVCGLAFDPNFGGEETETIKAWKAKQDAAAAKKDPPAAGAAEAEPAPVMGGGGKKKNDAGAAGGKGDV